MREILPGKLWLGNAGDGRAPDRLLQAGVVAGHPDDVSPQFWDAVRGTF